VRPRIGHEQAILGLAVVGAHPADPQQRLQSSELLAPSPAKARGGPGRGVFHINSNRDNPLPTSPAFAGGGARSSRPKPLPPGRSSIAARQRPPTLAGRSLPTSRDPPMPRPYLQLDVSADRPGAGNPLAVVLDAQGLDDDAMQAIARWTRLPETTFVFPATTPDADYRLRIFSPRHEVPFAGHPSVGTAHAVLEAALAAPRDGLLVQEGVAGNLPLRVEGDGSTRTIAVRTPRAKQVEVAVASDPRLRGALAGLPLGALPPALMDGGRRWWLAELRNEAALRSAEPDWDAIGQLARDTGSMGLDRKSVV